MSKTKKKSLTQNYRLFLFYYPYFHKIIISNPNFCFYQMIFIKNSSKKLTGNKFFQEEDQKKKWEQHFVFINFSSLWELFFINTILLFYKKMVSQMWCLSRKYSIENNFLIFFVVNKTFSSNLFSTRHTERQNETE